MVLGKICVGVSQTQNELSIELVGVVCEVILVGQLYVVFGGVDGLVVGHIGIFIVVVGEFLYIFDGFDERGVNHFEQFIGNAVVDVALVQECMVVCLAVFFVLFNMGNGNVGVLGFFGAGRCVYGAIFTDSGVRYIIVGVCVRIGTGCFEKGSRK